MHENTSNDFQLYILGKCTVHIHRLLDKDAIRKLYFQRNKNVNMQLIEAYVFMIYLMTLAVSVNLYVLL